MIQNISLFKWVFTSNTKVLFLLCLIFIIAEIIVNPIGNFPLNDDWWYAKTILKEQNLFDPKNWGYTSMLAQILYGKLLVFIFGPSYTVLRISTLFIGFSGGVFFYLLLEKFILKNKVQAFLLASLVLFSPLYFSLSNSFMTDIPCISFALAGLFFYFKHEDDKKTTRILASAAFFILAVLTRQLAIAFVIGIFVADVFITRKINIGALFLLLTALLSLFLFEYFLYSRNNPTVYSYFFFGSDLIAHAHSLTNIAFNFLKRWIHYISFTGFVLSPLLIPHLIYYFRDKLFKSQKNIFAISTVLFIPVLISLRKFPIGNYLYNAGVGPETLVDTYIYHFNNSHANSYIMFWLILLLSLGGSFSLLLLLTQSINTLRVSFKTGTEINRLSLSIFISLFFYYSFLSIQSAIFDRYIMVFSVLIIPVIFQKAMFINTRLFKGLLFFMAVFSLLTTKDYLNSSRTRWEAVSFLKNNYRISDREINAGYEHEGHCFGDSANWLGKWQNLQKNNYLVTHGPMPNYSTYTWITYQRYIPYKMDTVFILKRSRANFLP